MRLIVAFADELAAKSFLGQMMEGRGTSHLGR
jgi:hypothetical protein